MRLRYTRHASLQLKRIARYIAERSPLAAGQVNRRIREIAKHLAEYPGLGHEGALLGTREFSVPGLPYILVYRVERHDPNTLTILAVYHGAQLRPGQATPADD